MFWLRNKKIFFRYSLLAGGGLATINFCLYLEKHTLHNQKLIGKFYLNTGIKGVDERCKIIIMIVLAFPFYEA